MTARPWEGNLRAGVLVSKSPEDPEEREAWARQMARLQYAMWVDDGASCRVCGRRYRDVDDFLARNPRLGYLLRREGLPDFVDEGCWNEDEERRAREAARRR